jgi:hypothetical protein
MRERALGVQAGLTFVANEVVVLVMVRGARSTATHGLRQPARRRGPGMEQAFSKAPVQGGIVELGESSSQPPLRSPPVQPPPQSAGSQAFQPPPQAAGKQPVQPPLQASGQPIQPPPQGSTGQPVQQPNPYQPTYRDLAFGSPGTPLTSGQRIAPATN